MSLEGLKLFELLPSLYKLRDAAIAQSAALLTQAEQLELQTLQAQLDSLSDDQEQQLKQLQSKAARGPLQSLLMIVEEQLAILSEDLDQLYDDQFIETCAKWVIPYIGDLIGYQAVNGIAPAVASPRAEVANTISFRRRKGTVLVMEQLARDVTGWAAHAVEFFQLLGDTQYMNHLRLNNRYASDLSNWKVGTYIDTGFDCTAHKVDVRRIGSALTVGRYNIQNIGVFLWSLTAYSQTNSPATQVDGQPQCFRFSTLGRDLPLFNNPIWQGGEITAPAGPPNVPSRLKRRGLCADLAAGAGASYYGAGASLAIYVQGKLLDPYQIQVCDLSGADGAWINVPANDNYAAAIDPELGRIAIPPPAAGAKPDVRVSFYYGFNAAMGGGEYARAASFKVQDPAWVLPYPDTVNPPRYATLQQALTVAKGELAENGQVAIEIAGSDVYTEASLSVDLPAGTTLELRAADGARPTVKLDGEFSASGDASSALQVNGLLIASTAAPANPTPAAIVHVPAARPDGSPNLLGQLQLSHCTLVPGWALKSDGSPVHGGSPTLIAEPSGLKVTASNSIAGPMLIGKLVSANLTNCIVDASAPANVAYAALDGLGGGALTMQGCTVIGKVHASLLSQVSDSIFWAALSAGDKFRAALWSDRKQAGCVRFSFLPINAITPRQFECVEQAPFSAQPLFFSLRYGDAGYGKLLTSTPDVIRRGADDGAEMGAFHFVLAPLRESDLRVRLQEYLPVRMEFGIIYQD